MDNREQPSLRFMGDEVSEITMENHVVISEGYKRLDDCCGLAPDGSSAPTQWDGGENWKSKSAVTWGMR